MNIKTEIRKTFDNKGRLMAIANLIVEDCFVIKNIRLIEGKKGLFVSMPSNKIGDKYIETCHPICQEARKKIEGSVIEAYKSAIS